jgi:hypothetical protein
MLYDGQNMRWNVFLPPIVNLAKKGVWTSDFSCPSSCCVFIMAGGCCAALLCPSGPRFTVTSERFSRSLKGGPCPIYSHPSSLLKWPSLPCFLFCMSGLHCLAFVSCVQSLVLATAVTHSRAGSHHVCWKYRPRLWEVGAGVRLYTQVPPCTAVWQEEAVIWCQTDLF